MNNKIAAIPIQTKQKFELFSVNRLLKGFLFFIILVLPFQGLPRTFFPEGTNPFIRFISFIDELTFLFSVSLLITFILLKPSLYRIRNIPFTKYIFLYVIVAIISLLINRVSLLQGGFGIYDVLKNIFVFYVFAHLDFSREDIFKLIRWMQNSALIIGVVALFAELFAFGWQVGVGYFVSEEERLGLYRVFSLTGFGTWNYLGIYMALIFFLTTATKLPTVKRVTIYGISLVTLILTFSRQAWLGFALMFSLFKKQLIPIAIIMLVVVLWMFLTDIHVFQPEKYFRGYAFLQSLQILKEHPLFGVGPGMFGGVAASIFGSPYYADWPKYFKELMTKFRGIDQFWPWIWSEGGAIGLLAYLSIWVSLYVYFMRLGTFFMTKGDKDMYNLAKVLRYFIFVIVIMGFGGGLNIAFVIFTYFALGGIYASIYFNQQKSE